ncbi:RNA polymerase sigma factor [uncultured Jatrophihabitans sp.]|uniref:RNA polymerase sigma factor n=1 Tax=uncultured Jatrophihabitans sp. TaxID=1610747 RepID=UPI0035CB2C3C
MNDDELIQAAREGQSFAAAFLVSVFGPRMLGFAKSIAPDLSDTDREHAVEIAVETAVRKIDKFDPSRGRFESWLRTFIVHAAQDWRRGHLRLVSLDAEDPDGDSLRDRIPARADLTGTPDSAPPKPLLDVLREVVPTMRVGDQVILALRDMEGRSIETTASVLGISVPACRQRHHRARMRLKALLVADPRTPAELRGEQA